jgi:phosphorylcholine metabolism protein LicD
MNEHLKCVFEIVLPAVEQAGIRYWVYGGVAIAGIKGKFMRPNHPDVDLFVMEDDYEKIVETISKFESALGWTPKDDESEKRKKRNWFAPGRDENILSVVPGVS